LDTVIYASIANSFSGRIHAVYIRDTYQKKSHSVQQVLQHLEETGVPCCCFSHSTEAIAHSKKIGLPH
jgi:phosphatidate phosphatase APP1